jgi:hypothetical protein
LGLVITAVSRLPAEDRDCRAVNIDIQDEQEEERQKGLRRVSLGGSGCSED